MEYFDSVEEKVIYLKLNTEGMPKTMLGKYLVRLKLEKELVAYRPLVSHRAFIGKFIVLCKRIMRKCFKWYIEPICSQQTIFNNDVVDALYLLQEQYEKQEAKLTRCMNELQSLHNELANCQKNIEILKEQEVHKKNMEEK